MKRKLITTLTLLALGAGTTAFAASSVPLNSQTDKASYAIGYDMGKAFSEQDLGIELNQFEAGFQAGMSGTTPAMTEADMKAVLIAFQQEKMQEAMQKQQAQAAANSAASTAYLAKIAKQPGVQQLTTGLYYKVLTKGTGSIPSPTDTVTVNYEGTLVDGTVFDSSYKRGQPATFQVNQVIPGWSQVLQKMPAGSTWMVYIAPALAYGNAAPPQIGPGQALTFKIELISVQKASAQNTTTGSAGSQ